MLCVQSPFSFAVVLDKKANKNADTGLFELAYRQPAVVIPSYTGINLQVDGLQIKNQVGACTQRESASSCRLREKTTAAQSSGETMEMTIISRRSSASTEDVKEDLTFCQLLNATTINLEKNRRWKSGKKRGKAQSVSSINDENAGQNLDTNNNRRMGMGRKSSVAVIRGRLTRSRLRAASKAEAEACPMELSPILGCRKYSKDLTSEPKSDQSSTAACQNLSPTDDMPRVESISLDGGGGRESEMKKQNGTKQPELNVPSISSKTDEVSTPEPLDVPRLVRNCTTIRKPVVSQQSQKYNTTKPPQVFEIKEELESQRSTTVFPVVSQTIDLAMLRPGAAEKGKFSLLPVITPVGLKSLHFKPRHLCRRRNKATAVLGNCLTLKKLDFPILPHVPPLLCTSFNSERPPHPAAAASPPRLQYCHTSSHITAVNKSRPNYELLRLQKSAL